MRCTFELTDRPPVRLDLHVAELIVLRLILSRGPRTVSPRAESGPGSLSQLSGPPPSRGPTPNHNGYPQPSVAKVGLGNTTPHSDRGDCKAVQHYGPKI
jgi:hypothetical protein